MFVLTTMLLNRKMRLCVFLLCAVVTAAAPPKKHIIHIMADDLGRDNLGKLNNGLTDTPNINGLIEDGLFLNDFHTFKICGPSRASTMTGWVEQSSSFFPCFLLCWYRHHLVLHHSLHHHSHHHTVYGRLS